MVDYVNYSGQFFGVSLYYQPTTKMEFCDIMNSPDPLFNAPNFAYWLALAIVILLETQRATGWPEPARWRLGYVTLFGSALLMVIFSGWHGPTWALLTLFSLITHILPVDRLLFDNLWERREAHRWTVQYFSAVIFSIPYLQWDGHIDTWAALFFGLGICGAVKVGAHAYRDSHRAAALRRTRYTEEADYGGDYRQGF